MAPRGQRLTQKQETFCLKYCEIGNATEAALIAGYSKKTAQTIAAENLCKPLIIGRIDQLRQIAEDASIATVLERKQVLTEIIRGRFSELMSQLTPEKLKSAALQEIRITTIGKDTPVKTTTIKLNDPVRAIGELNKMERIYESDGGAYIDNRTLNIYVNSDKAKDLTQRLIAGERTGGDNGNKDI